MNNDLVSFQNGVDTIVDGCTTYGSTPTASTPSAIVNSINTIYTNRYSAGITQGRNDVTDSPNTYGLYTSTQYNNKKVLSGNGNMTMNDHSSSSKSISFSSAFSATPIIVVILKCTNFFSYTISNNSKTGFTLNISRAGGSSGYVEYHWYAYI